MKKYYSLFVILMVMTTMSCCKKNLDPMETKIGDTYESGYVFQTKTADQPGIICSIGIIAEQSNWDNAVQLCNNYSVGGKGWRLPTYNELKLIYQTLSKKIDFMSHVYWSSTPKLNSPYMLYFNDVTDSAHPEQGLKSALHSVITVKEF